MKILEVKAPPRGTCGGRIAPAPVFHAIWQKIRVKNPEQPMPSPRTSHTCVGYKNRYLVVIGGETTSDLVASIKDVKEVSEEESKDIENLSEKKINKNESSASEEKRDQKAKEDESPKSVSRSAKQEEDE